jgi:hypothetical protein
MISIGEIEKVVEKALHRAEWVIADPAEEYPDGAEDLKRLGTKALSGKTEDGWRFVLVSFSIEGQHVFDATGKRMLVSYDGMATRSHENLMVHLTRRQAEAAFKLAMGGMN